MADSKLSREHSLALLHKLATDDDYRARYEQSPADAITELGVPSDTVANLMASCAVSGRLASKEQFANARQRLLDASANACVEMNVPDAKLSFGSA